MARRRRHHEGGGARGGEPEPRRVRGARQWRCRLPGRTVLESGTLEMRDKTEAAQSPLAERLFEIQGVGGVFLGSDFITVTKAGSEWPQLKPAILGVIMEHFMSGAPIVAAGTSGEIAEA